MDTLFRISKQFRMKLEGLPTKERPLEIMTFPSGACELSSVLLANLLVKYGYKVLVVRGKRSVIDEAYSCEVYKEVGHTWLEVDGKIIDITADQFVDCEEAVIVSERTIFHDSFEIISKTFDMKDWLKENYRYLIATKR
ncbi:hypothetical protein [Vibrio gallaecicus]|uniref:Uncharacterized protein n=1 Tax=Vibrio gallaecicus TaxID=552386 RepID=A0ABV4NH68_9VIBR